MINFSAAADAVGDAVSDIGDGVGDFFGDAWDKVDDAADEARRRAADAYEEATEAVGELLAEVSANVEHATSALQQLNPGLTSFGPEVWQSANQFVWDAVEAHVAWVDDAVALVEDAALEAWEVAEDLAAYTASIAQAVAENPLVAVALVLESQVYAAVRMVSAAIEVTEAAAMFAVDFMEEIALVFGNVLRSALELLKTLGGCMGGKAVYLLTKADLLTLNVSAHAHPFLPPEHLSSDFRRSIKSVFGSEKFDEVRYIDNAHFPQDYWGDDSKDAICMGNVQIAGVHTSYMIYFRDDVWPDTTSLMVHELVHVQQYRRFGGEAGFACAYGIAVVEGGYDNNALEDEAYAFETLHEQEIESWGGVL